MYCQRVMAGRPAGAKQPRSNPTTLRPLAAPLAAGQPLPQHVRQQMESSFGHSFANVRIFPSGLISRQVEEQGASALTSGEAISLGPGVYRPSDPGALKVLRHELTHVLQQRYPSGASYSSLEGRAVRNEGSARQFAPAASAAATMTPMLQAREPKITRFHVDRTANAVTVDLDDGTSIHGTLETLSVPNGEYQVTYDDAEDKLIVKEVGGDEDVIFFTINLPLEVRQKYKKALEAIDEPTPFVVTGSKFGDLTIPEDPFSVDDTGVLSEKEPDKGGAPYDVTILTAGEVSFPNWVPGHIQAILKHGEYSKLNEYLKREGRHPGKGDGVYIVPRESGPWGDLWIYIDHPGGGYVKIEVFQEFPESRKFYEELAGDNPFQTQLYYDVYTGHNKDIAYFVLEQGYSISGAREELRRIHIEVTKLVFEATAALFTSAFGMGAAASPGGRPSSSRTPRGAKAKSAGSKNVSGEPPAPVPGGNKPIPTRSSLRRINKTKKENLPTKETVKSRTKAASEELEARARKEQGLAEGENVCLAGECTNVKDFRKSLGEESTESLTLVEKSPVTDEVKAIYRDDPEGLRKLMSGGGEVGDTHGVAVGRTREGEYYIFDPTADQFLSGGQRVMGEGGTASPKFEAAYEQGGWVKDLTDDGLVFFKNEGDLVQALDTLADLLATNENSQIWWALK